VSFLDRAKQAASQAAEQAKAAAEQARQTATETAGKAQSMINDPATAEKARQAMSKARRGMATAIDRIDPNVLADIIIKATALQERANSALKAKGSPYRISEIGIGASIPPSVTFAIARTDDPDVDIVPDGAVASTELVAGVVTHADAVQALDGSVIDASSLEAEPGE
jgi:hypothetical protein